MARRKNPLLHQRPLLSKHPLLLQSQQLLKPLLPHRTQLQPPLTQQLLLLTLPRPLPTQLQPLQLALPKPSNPGVQWWQVARPAAFAQKLRPQGRSFLLFGCDGFFSSP
ncbi:hypothetical protein KYG_16782 [Acidovorax sp. NO-1]|nr:hypothetical protein KYG_16782 [Acidovorax sp. NO-1]